MNAQKFTQKSIEAIQNAEKTVLEYGNPQIEPVHLIRSLVHQENGLIPSLLEKMGINVTLAQNLADEYVAKLPKAMGTSREQGKIYISPSTEKALSDSEDCAKNMNDEYVSVEHIFMTLIESNETNVRDFMKRLGIDKNGFLTALRSVRSANRVTSDNPEATYEALKKYGYDLVERARQHKIDPVIGRDGEIRSVVRILS
ncbi:MAG: type VI secretion system ATPase TssH, partial [Clostridia bacterium]|nr:type VI secretion system ATPase TssH [Clostridia bacterium]